VDYAEKTLEPKLFWRRVGGFFRVVRMVDRGYGRKRRIVKSLFLPVTRKIELCPGIEDFK
jgi:hypothetical protein